MFPTSIKKYSQNLVQLSQFVAKQWILTQVWLSLPLTITSCCSRVVLRLITSLETCVSIKYLILINKINNITTHYLHNSNEDNQLGVEYQLQIKLINKQYLHTRSVQEIIYIFSSRAMSSPANFISLCVGRPDLGHLTFKNYFCSS